MHSFLSCRHCGQPIAVPIGAVPGCEVKCAFCGELTMVPVGTTSQPQPAGGMPPSYAPTAPAQRPIPSDPWSAPPPPQQTPYPSGPFPGQTGNVAPNPFGDVNYGGPSQKPQAAGMVNPYQAPLTGSPYNSFNRSVYGLPLAGRGERLVAAMIDGGAFFGLMVVGILLAAGLIAAITDGGRRREADVAPLIFMFAFVPMIALAIFQMVLVARTGQSVGKWLMGIRLANATDDAVPNGVNSILLRMFVNGLISSFIPLYSLIDHLLIFGDERRCLHDMIAGTRVVVKESRQYIPTGADQGAYLGR